MSNLVSPVYDGGVSHNRVPGKMPPVTMPPAWGLVRTLNTMLRGSEYDVPDATWWPLVRQSCSVLNKHLDRAYRTSGGTPCPAFVTVFVITKGDNPRKILRVVRVL